MNTTEQNNPATPAISDNSDINIGINQEEARTDTDAPTSTSDSTQSDTVVTQTEQDGQTEQVDDLIDFSWDREKNPISEFVKDEEISSFIEQAKKMGLKKSQVEEIVKYQNAKIEEQVTEIQTQKEASLEALKKEFGKNVDLVISESRNAMKKVGVFDLLVEKYGLGNDAELIKAFATINKSFNETTFPLSAVSNNRSLEDQIRELQAPDGALMNRAHRDHDMAVQKYKILIEQKAQLMK